MNIEAPSGHRLKDNKPYNNRPRVEIKSYNLKPHIHKIASCNEIIKENLENRLNGHGPLDKFGVLTDKKIQDIFTQKEIKEAERLKKQKETNASNIQSKTQEKTDEIVQKINKIDSKTQKKSPADKAAARLSLFNGGIHYITDCDNTLTSTDKLNNHLIPGSTYAEPMLNPQRSNFEAVHTLIWQQAAENNPELFRDGGKLAPIRKGVQDFIDIVEQSGDKITIASANHMSFVEGVRSKLDGNIEVHALHPKNVNALDKKTVVKEAVFDNTKKQKDKAVIFIGDGKSDLEILNNPDSHKGDIYTYIYALKGSPFAQALEKKKILHGEFRNFNDIIEQQKIIQEKADKIKPHTAHIKI